MSKQLYYELMRERICDKNQDIDEAAQYLHAEIFPDTQVGSIIRGAQQWAKKRHFPGLSELRNNRKLYTNPEGFQFAPNKAYLDYPLLQEDNAIIAGDFEAPDHDETMLLLIWYVAQELGISHFIGSGDLISSDQPGLSSHPSKFTRPYQATLDQTVESILSFLNGFQKVTLIEGNHDDMMKRASQGQNHLGQLLGANKKDSHISYSEYGYLYIETSRPKEDGNYVLVAHPINFGSPSLNLGTRLYNPDQGPFPDRELIKPHIVLAHCHDSSMGWSPDARRQIIGHGTMRDPNKTQYIQMRKTPFRKWSQSFVVMQDGFMELYDKRWTNWKKLLPLQTFNRIFND
jgi:hypothetical protein